METLAINISGTIREQTLYGKRYLVAPLSMIVEGVLPGSEGPLFYPSAEIKSNPVAWNHMPIVVYHPTDGAGNGISARHPDVLNKSGIGFVFNTSVKDEIKLLAEGWLDIELADKINPSIIANVRAGLPGELSTGLFLDKDPGAGVFNGKSYDATARNYRPDHLAILPDQKGACSVSDGCGVNMNSTKDNPITQDKEDTMSLTAEQKKAKVDFLIGNCDCWVEEDRETLNGFSDEKIVSLEGTLKKGIDNEKISTNSTKPWKDKDGNEYVFNTESGVWDRKPAQQEKKDDASKPDETVTNGSTDSKASSQEHKMTTEEVMGLLPAEVREDLEFARNEKAKQKHELIVNIVSNHDEDKRQALGEGLEKKTLAELIEINSLIPAKKEEPQRFRPSYAGAAAPAGNSYGMDEDNDGPIPPTINWNDK